MELVTPLDKAQCLPDLQPGSRQILFQTRPHDSKTAPKCVDGAPEKRCTHPLEAPWLGTRLR